MQRTPDNQEPNGWKFKLGAGLILGGLFALAVDLPTKISEWSVQLGSNVNSLGLEQGALLATYLAPVLGFLFLAAGVQGVAQARKAR